MNPIFETYFTRFEAFEQQSQKPVDRNLGIIVTIPCYHEPDILQTLNCLLNCTMPSCRPPALHLTFEKKKKKKEVA